MFERLRKLAGASGKPAFAEQDVDRLIAEADRLRSEGGIEGARAHYLKAHDADPTRVYPLYWLATLAQDAGELTEARSFCERALARDPDQVGMLLRLAGVCADQGDDISALEAYERVASLDPSAPIEANLADRYCRLGRIVEGVAAFDRAILRTPDKHVLQHNRLFVMNFASEFTPEQTFARHRQWAQEVERRVAPAAAPPPARAAKLVVGYLSSDLRDHAVAHFIEPLLREHDRARFDIHCFDTSPDPEDEVAHRLRELPVHWHRIAKLDDDALTGLIRRLDVNILVDLAGHTKGGRLEVFARRAAPVQVTWLGYLGSTGLTRMDYRLTDEHMDPPGLTEHLHSESLVRLPVHACFEPWRGAPEPSPSPCAAGRPMTFGSVNQWPKVSLAARKLWAEILVSEPGSRLFVVLRGGQHLQMSQYVRAQFCAYGARPEQIQVFPYRLTADFLRFLSDIDVALDPFPYGGGTTTMQCLWMGVPVVTLAGSCAFSRNSIGPLHGAGLGDLVARSPSEYREVALGLGRDAQRLSDLRGSLRKTISRSSLMDAKTFARSVEDTYTEMWQRQVAQA